MNNSSQIVGTITESNIVNLINNELCNLGFESSKEATNDSSKSTYDCKLLFQNLVELINRSKRQSNCLRDVQFQLKLSLNDNQIYKNKLLDLEEEQQKWIDKIAKQTGIIQNYKEKVDSLNKTIKTFNEQVHFWIEF
jgi:hypothetical protein